MAGVVGQKQNGPSTTPLECARIGGHIDLYYSMVKQQPPPPVPEIDDDSDDTAMTIAMTIALTRGI